MANHEPQSPPRCIVLGGTGFVGSAVVTEARECGWRVAVHSRRAPLPPEQRDCDILINANGSAVRFRAEHDPVADFEDNVSSVYRSLHDFRFQHYVYCSTVDVYPHPSHPETTREDAEIDIRALGTYGLHKRMAELLVLARCPSWNILRLAQMVGPGLRKGPIFDLLAGAPLRIDPRARFNLLRTATVAKIMLRLIVAGPRCQIFNLCGRGSISFESVIRQLGDVATPRFIGSELQLYDVDTAKLAAIVALPDSQSELTSFLTERSSRGAGSAAQGAQP